MISYLSVNVRNPSTTVYTIVIGKGQDTKQKTRKMSRYKAGQDRTKKEPMNKTQNKKQEEDKIQGKTRPNKTEPIITVVF